MPDDIKIKVTAEGIPETTKQWDGLNTAMSKSVRLQEMLAKTSQDIQRRNLVNAIKQEAAAVNGLTEVMVKNEKVATSVNQQISNFRRGLGPAAALVGTLGGAFSNLTPQASGAMGAVQKFVSAMNQAMALAGAGSVAGPWGAVAGGAVGLISGIATAMGQAKSEADALAKATADNAKALGDYMDQIGRLRAQVAQKYDQRKAESTRYSDLSKGKGSEEDYEKAILADQARLENPYYRDMYIDAARQDRKEPGSGDALISKRKGEADYIRAQIEKSQRWLQDTRANAAAARENAQGKFDTEGDIIEAGGLPENGKEKKSQIELDLERIRANRGQTNDGSQFLMDQAGAEKPSASMYMGGQDAWEKQRKDELDYIKKTSDMQEAIVAQKNAKLIALEKQKAAAIEQIRNQETAAAMSATQMVTGAALKGISELIKGKEVEAGAILEGLGDQFVAAGTGLIFSGLGISANPFTPGAGAGMIGVGVAEVAFGLGLGGAGASMPGGSAADGGGDAGAAKAANDPYRNSFTPPNQGGPTVINLNFPTVLSPSAIDGARMESALRQAKRVYG